MFLFGADLSVIFEVDFTLADFLSEFFSVVFSQMLVQKFS